jgi:hypothetical protein
VVSFTPRPLNPRERAPGTHWIGGWMGSKSVLDAVVVVVVVMMMMMMMMMMMIKIIIVHMGVELSSLP